jgi:cyclopropane-fatty-acyl-phospholipid synthase
VNVVGLRLSKNRATLVQKSFDEMESPRSKRVLLNGWEQFDEPADGMVLLHTITEMGFTLTRRQSLQPHYARTLDLWAEALEAHQDEAIAIQSAFRIGYIDVNQFTLEK